MYVTNSIHTSIFYSCICTLHPQILSAFYLLPHLQIRLLHIANKFRLASYFGPCKCVRKYKSGCTGSPITMQPTSYIISRQDFDIHRQTLHGFMQPSNFYDDGALFKYRKSSKQQMIVQSTAANCGYNVNLNQNPRCYCEKFSTNNWMRRSRRCCMKLGAISCNIRLSSLFVQPSFIVFFALFRRHIYAIKWKWSTEHKKTQPHCQTAPKNYKLFVFFLNSLPCACANALLYC